MSQHLGGSREGRRKMEQLHLSGTWVHLGMRSLVPEGHEQPASPLLKGELKQGIEDNPQSPNRLPSRCQLLPCSPERTGTPILAFRPPATRHQPAGSLCDIPAWGAMGGLKHGADWSVPIGTAGRGRVSVNRREKWRTVLKSH